MVVLIHLKKTMAMYRLLLLAVAFQGIVCLPVQIGPKATDPKYRLPKDVVPSEYTINLKPYFVDSDPNKAFSFEGDVQIKLRAIRSDIRRITMHSAELTIESPPTIVPNLPLRSMTFDDKYQFVDLNLDSAMATNTDYTVSFRFKGKMQTDNNGFFKGSYTERNVTKWYGATQFGPYRTRKVFPSFDEPEFKAVFKLTIDCPTGMICASNMREKERDGSNVIFHDSPIMSSYLLAFIVGDFQRDASPTDSDFGIWRRPEAAGQSAYALEQGVKLLAELDQYTGLPFYDMHQDNIKMKMDQVALPDFGPGAMENWGLLKYKEPYIMIDPDESSTMSKENAAAILGHEITHMWFGDLVTCKWFSELWLNEGFARFYEYYITNKVVPGFHFDRQFVRDQVQGALANDVSLNNPPLTNQEVNSQDEIGDQFRLAYNKGSAVIRMMENWLGASTFRKGINYFLTDKIYQGAVPDDLFRSLQKAADEDQSITSYAFNVKQVFDSWTVKAGYPILYASIDRDGMTVIRQQRYLASSSSDNGDRYMIPITYASARRPSFADTKPLFIMNNSTWKLDTGTETDWIIFNVQQTGFYRVMYSEEMYENIVWAFENDNTRKIVHEFNRAQIVDDALNYAFDGKLYYDETFDIIQWMENETDYVPWAALMNEATILRRDFSTFNDLSKKFDLHILTLMTKVIADLSFDISPQDDELRRMFRTRVMSLACKMGHKPCQDKAVELLEKWVDDKSYRIPPDHREFVYCSGLRFGDASFFDQLWVRYMNQQVVNEQIIILDTLGCTFSASNIRKLLEYTLDPQNPIPDQYKLYAFNSALRNNGYNVAVVFEFFRTNVHRFRTSYNELDFEDILWNLGGEMSRNELRTYKEFLQSSNNNLTSADREVGLDSIDSKERTMQWVESVEKEIVDWINWKYNLVTDPQPKIPKKLGMLKDNLRRKLNEVQFSEGLERRQINRPRKMNLH